MNVTVMGTKEAVVLRLTSPDDDEFETTLTHEKAAEIGKELLAAAKYDGTECPSGQTGGRPRRARDS